MRIYLPPPMPAYNEQQMFAHQEALIRALVPVVTSEEAVPQLYLQAVDGGVWRVTVTNSGGLTTTKVQG